MGLKEESQSTTEQKEEKTEQVKQSAGDKMKERAEAIIEKAEASLNQERTTNTYRQSAQAGRAEDKARQEIIFAKKLILIAEGLENGNIKYLHKIRNGKQLEQLEQILSRGYYYRTKDLSTYEKQNECKNLSLDVNFIKYPNPEYGYNVIQNVFMPYSDTAGMKQAVKKILDYGARYKDKNDHVILEGNHIIDLFKTTASKISNVWAKDRILDSIKDFERIQKMGLTNEAILRTGLRELISLTEGTDITEEEKKAIELKELERSFKSKKIDGFFPTPKPLIEKMFEMARVFECETICEPEAGLGHIAEEIRLLYPTNDLSVNEYNRSLYDVLCKKGFNAENEDFLTTSKKHDVFFMNPPFEKDQDIDHVMHAYSLLNDGGRLVAIMAGNKESQQAKKKEFKEFVELNGYFSDNEEGSFKSSFNSTGVNTTTVYLEKSAN